MILKFSTLFPSTQTAVGKSLFSGLVLIVWTMKEHDLLDRPRICLKLFNTVSSIYKKFAIVENW